MRCKQIQQPNQNVKEKHCGLQSGTAFPLRNMQQNLQHRLCDWNDGNEGYVYGKIGPCQANL